MEEVQIEILPCEKCIHKQVCNGFSKIESLFFEVRLSLLKMPFFIKKARVKVEIECKHALKGV